MFKPTSSSAIFGRTAASLPRTAPVPGEESTPLQGATNKERTIRRFKEELSKLQDQGNHSNHASVASSSQNPAQNLPNSSGQLGENEQYAKALLIAVREEIYKKGYKSDNKIRAVPPNKDINQWIEDETIRMSNAGEEMRSIRMPFRTRSSSGIPYFLALQKTIQNAIEAKGHNCRDLVYAGVGILDSAGIKDTHFVYFEDFDHNMILIGKMPPTGLPLDMERWPAHLAICDPWGNIACPAKAFIPTIMEKMQKWERDGKVIYDSNKKAWHKPLYPELEKELRGRLNIVHTQESKEKPDENGVTPLIATVHMGNVDDVQILLKAGADIEAKDQYGRTPLMIAAERGNSEMVDALFKAGATLPLAWRELKDKDGRTPLIAAAYTGNVDDIQLLLKSGTDIEAKDKDGRTPLMIAAERGKFEMVDALLKAGANIEAKDSRGHTALMIAADNGNVKLARALLKTGAKDDKGRSELMYAAWSGNIEEVDAMLKAGADKEAVDTQGNTALIYAVKSGNLKVVEALLKTGVGADVPNHKGNTPLMHASCLGHRKIAETLLNAGANKNAVNRNGITPLIFAVLEGKFEVAKVLLKVRVNKSVPIQGNNKRYMALALAAIEGNFEEAILLIKEADADKVRDPDGKTVLIRAVEMMASDSDSCRKLGLQILQTLLAAGADITIQDTKGKTAKEYATELAIARDDQELLALIEAASRK